LLQKRGVTAAAAACRYGIAMLPARERIGRSISPNAKRKNEYSNASTAKQVQELGWKTLVALVHKGKLMVNA
jgi:hypothetical protein